MPATDTFVRDLKTVHVVFALSAVALFVSTIWMMAADHKDEWRVTQDRFEDIQAKRLRSEQAALTESERMAKVAKLEEELAEADAALNEKADDLEALQKRIRDLELEVDLASRTVRENRAVRDVERANLDLAIRDQRVPNVLNALKARFDRQQLAVEKLELDLQQKEAALKTERDKLKAETSRRDELLAELKNLRTDFDRIHVALNRIEPENPLFRAKRAIMKWPIIDGFNSPHKIVQDWLPDLKVTLGMARTARFDRCRTCHLAIDRVESGNVPSFPFGETGSHNMDDWIEAGKYPHPFATHPNPDLYVTASSPHPVGTFGCTICHDGNGSGTSFQNAEHGPNHPREANQWEHEYHYHANHFWEYPMLPQRFQEATCVKCHHNVTELGVHPEFGASAPKLYKGYQLIEKYGCFGCHEIHGYDAGKPIGPDLRLEPSTAEEAEKIAADPTQVAGQMRKVGPSLAHIASKTTAGWIEYWTEEPKRFRPDTRMPQFFKLSNQWDPKKLAEGKINPDQVSLNDLDVYETTWPDDPDVKVLHGAKVFTPLELAGVAQYLVDKSQPLTLEQPQEDYEPDADRGKVLFSRRGCLACHSHEEFPETKSDFGPNLTQVHAKIKPGEDGFHWLYTWIRHPERHHPRTRMPYLFLEPYQEGDEQIDPAADIAAFLLTKGEPAAGEPGASATGALPTEFPRLKINDKDLDELVRVNLAKVLTQEQARQTIATRKYPVDKSLIKGDEIELALVPEGGELTDDEWRRIKLNYVGRRTISQYGCYGCHDISGFETARPIGTALQDWGRKDTSRLALEHIEEYLHHHGEPDGSSTRERVATALKAARAGGAKAGEFSSEETEERELSTAYFMDNLLHHGRPGFLWQKLRDPRSYDYKKIETKGYNERLRMPKFPLGEEEIEAIATFVLGLVAEPPESHYLYQPQGPAAARIEGERLLEKFNCAGCHMLELPKIEYGADLDDLFASELGAGDHRESLDLLLKLKPPRNAETGKKLDSGEPVVGFHGLVFTRPDPEDDPEDQEFTFDLWETLQLGDKQLWPGSRMIVPGAKLTEQGKSQKDGYALPGRGGEFAEWLVESLMKNVTENNRSLAWQMAPPPLYLEGQKVQTPWLFQFLKDPVQLRHITVLRMPRFNMSNEEAQALANYFAAVDGVPYPYQDVPQRDPGYLAMHNTELAPLLGQDTDYLAESWKLLNAPLCIKCHSLGGRQFQVSDPKKDIRGPDLEYAANRLRPEWLLLWLYKPQWITPYTSMPPPLPANQKQFEDLFRGNATIQTQAIRDALMNYHRLMEREGKTVYEPKAAPVEAAGGE